MMMNDITTVSSSCLILQRQPGNFVTYLAIVLKSKIFKLIHLIIDAMIYLIFNVLCPPHLMSFSSSSFIHSIHIILVVTNLYHPSWMCVFFFLMLNIKLLRELSMLQYGCRSSHASTTPEFEINETVFEHSFLS